VIATRPLHRFFGAIVEGVDLTKRINDEAFAQLRNALSEFSVLVFPRQDINDAEQIAFSQRFGPLETTKIGTRGAGSPLVILSNIGEDNRIVPFADRLNMVNRANMQWHADSSFKRIPAQTSILSAREVPVTGGNTEFVSMRAVYAELPGDLRQAAENRVAIHDFAHSRDKVDPNLMTNSERTNLPPVRQAMVLDQGHKLGRSLYIGSHVSRVEGMTKSESRKLIDRLLSFATKEQFIYCHTWCLHDLVIWDNRSVIHRAQPFVNHEERRRMVRTTVAGVTPTVK
jgi:alpha-ketoglutarate-dependent 2,4-dichlorophenoxyacetate dioxygenase